MKLSFNLPLLLSAAFMAAPALALPNLHAMMAPGPNGEPSHLEKRLLSANPLHLNNLFNDIKNKVAELNSNVTVPDVGSLLNTKITDITPESIYNTFGIRRDLGLLPPAEDKYHPWQPPPKGAKRGPCPGLNTIANHGYLPRSGVINPIDLIVGTFLGLNLSPDLAGILAAISFVGMGDLLQMKLSIGGRYGLGGGLSHHGILEGDASVTRKDNYFGNSWDADPKLVKQFIQETNTYGKGNVNIWSLANSRYRAWDYGRKNNPVFDFNPWRMLVAYGESGFVHEVLRGSFVKFDETMIKNWFIDERFPKGWSKRIVPMTTPEILAWAGIVFVAKPTIPGWSIGKGAFIPLPTTDGAYQELKSLLDPKTTGATLESLLCDASNAVLGFFPSQITNLLGVIGIKGVGAQFKCK
ncbi:uncharacterized protein UMAG_03112 [Mycosarcoma maydis]|uniref:Heme haloperoxidase family profile domain-containing protein n=1 Tax=Mycosarcoma maydis TaxID=5270 RepID=A0A0D1DZV2_MYCMD|nr:uncharacterized protein UMAG_03112 [Ustilago maydis 521]KIS69141.1 hypothetical protein UMAG_03112 [Ustilago maydis 521]|eukprot:XP_011389463.1 hypothetical protein UMAG_03112 [Ustilago maydis 521]